MKDKTSAGMDERESDDEKGLGVVATVGMMKRRGSDEDKGVGAVATVGMVEMASDEHNNKELARGDTSPKDVT